LRAVPDVVVGILELLAGNGGLVGPVLATGADLAEKVSVLIRIKVPVVWVTRWAERSQGIAADREET
jgi:hypothetical protein